MSRSPFDPDFEALPARLPIFPLPGALLLPGGRLPLNIFEPRYLEMFEEALGGPRLIGMIQPNVETGEPGSAPLHDIGCAGRIAAFSETEDGRFLVTLSGVIRFAVTEELPACSYRKVRPDYSPYQDDLTPDAGSIERERLLVALKAYFQAQTIDGDWNSIEQADDERLVIALSMLCPLQPWEKQLLLEADGLSRRAEALTALLESAIHEPEEAPRPN